MGVGARTGLKQRDLHEAPERRAESEGCVMCTPRAAPRASTLRFLPGWELTLQHKNEKCPTCYADGYAARAYVGVKTWGGVGYLKGLALRAAKYSMEYWSS